MSFEAKFRGVCAYGDKIAVGDYCVYVEDDIAHVECAAMDGPVWEKPAPTCSACFMQHVGECL